MERYYDDEDDDEDDEKERAQEDDLLLPSLYPRTYHSFLKLLVTEKSSGTF